MAASASTSLPGLSLVRSVVLLPLVLPPVVGGLTLLFLLGRTGPLGGFLDREFGITVPFSTTAVVLAQTFVAMPFLVVSLEGALRTAGARYETVAATISSLDFRSESFCTAASVRILAPKARAEDAIASEIAPIPPLTWPQAPPTPSSSPSSWCSRL